jgi:hypothetical protein
MWVPQDLKIFSLGPRRNRSWSSLLYVLNLTTSTEESRVLNERPIVRSARGETLRLLQNTKAHCRVHKSSPPALSWARWIQSPPRPCFNIVIGIWRAERYSQTVWGKPVRLTATREHVTAYAQNRQKLSHRRPYQKLWPEDVAQRQSAQQTTEGYWLTRTRDSRCAEPSKPRPPSYVSVTKLSGASLVIKARRILKLRMGKAFRY